MTSFIIDWFDLLAVQGILKSLLQNTIQKHQLFRAQSSVWPSSHICTWLLEKPNLQLQGSLSAKWSLLFNTLPRFVITYCFLISWLQSLWTVILELKKIVTVFTVSPSICHEMMGPDSMILVFWMLSFKPIFTSLSANLILIS